MKPAKALGFAGVQEEQAALIVRLILGAGRVGEDQRVAEKIVAQRRPIEIEMFLQVGLHALQLPHLRSVEQRFAQRRGTERLEPIGFLPASRVALADRA